MRSLAVTITLFLCSISWISVSGSETQTVEVQSGEEVTLLCSNISKMTTQTEWFRLVNRSKPRCISSMYEADNETSYCDGFEHGFEMSSNISTVFLKIKRVDLSDSGLYFCSFYKDSHTVISTAVHLKVEGKGESDNELAFKTKKEPDGMTNLMTVILGALTVFLTIVVTVLAVKIRKLQTALTKQLQPEINEESDYSNSAAPRFLPVTRINTHASEREVKSCVIYTAS
ncbi:uncharacterized protein [Channa argus]|uniref:uncharacterized protein n=1 Tax=Channa argus TaxID=215402 RepID=UPI00351FA87D